MEKWLLVSLLLPVIGAGVVCALGSRGRNAVRQSAILTTLLTLIAVGVVVAHYPTGSAAPAHSEAYASTDMAWLGHSSQVNIQFSLGLDGLSIWLYGLAALLMVTAVLVSWEAITERPTAFFALLLLLETGMLGVFAARDIILFYIFFEFTLIPLFFLIGIWGSEERRHAASKFFIFTFAGSVLTFLGLLAIVLWNQSRTGVLTFSIPELTDNLARLKSTLSPDELHHWIVLQRWLFVALMAGFAIKVPLFPLHTWLPLAHTQAPTAGSVLLAGILLKLGGYGFVRFNIGLLPDAAAYFMPLLLWLSVIGILYGALVSLVQSDMKRLIAYSSVSHLGFCLLGLFALNRLGMQGGVLQMVNHGLSTGGLFAVIGMLYERYHTRKISDFGGLAARTPRLAVCMLIFTFSSIGLPGLNGFAGEFLLMQGMFQRGWSGPLLESSGQLRVIAVLAVFGVVLGAWYMLWLVQRVFFGPLKEPAQHDGGKSHAPHVVSDLSVREGLALAPLLVFVFWIGLFPGMFLERIAPTVDPLAQNAAASLNTTALAATAPQPIDGAMTVSSINSTAPSSP